MNVRFVVRGTLLAIPVALLAAALGVLWVAARANPIGPLPPPPTVLAPRGEFPAGPAGLTEWARYRGEDYALVGSGFLLRLDGGPIVGVTTAHGLALDDPARPLERIAFGLPGAADGLIEFESVLAGGVPRTGDDLSVDFVLLRLPAGAAIDPALALLPDPRGAPQAGERVAMLSGLGDGKGGRRVLDGTVMTADGAAAWVAMDDLFNPGGMSGSPFVSRHTGRVVGMAIAVVPRGGRLTIGLNPVAALTAQVPVSTDGGPPSVGPFGMR